MANANPQTGNTGVHLRNIRFATKGLNKRLDLLFSASLNGCAGRAGEK